MEHNHATVSEAENARGIGNFVSAATRSLLRPSRMPQDTNRWKEPLDGRVPVVLIHGTWMNAFNTYARLAPEIARTGRPVFCFNYGQFRRCLAGLLPAVRGTRPLLDSRAEVAGFIRQVGERTGAQEVDIVAHSQGVAQARMFINDVADEAQGYRGPQVRKLIGLGGNNHGTACPWAFLGRLRPAADKLVDLLVGPALTEQFSGSATMAFVNRKGDTVPGVSYTMLATSNDHIVVPWKSQFLDEGPGSSVTNIDIKQGAVKDVSDHVAMLYSPRVINLVLAALDEPGNAERYPSVDSRVLPWIGEIPDVPEPARRLGARARRGLRTVVRGVGN